MAIDSVSDVTTSTLTGADTSSGVNPNGILGKDDFMQLLLTQLQYQDPTEPMDSDKILQQTSELAALESSENTRNALEELSASLLSSQKFSTVSAIGKIADTGDNGVTLPESGSASFDLYFPSDAQSGSISISDSDGNIVKTIAVKDLSKGTYNYEWNGVSDGNAAMEAGEYSVTATYVDGSGNTQGTQVGRYPIESIKFEDGEPYAKMGSSYVSFDSIQEVTEGS